MKQKVFAFGCTVCHKSFTQLDSLGKHVKKFHSRSESKKKVENPKILKEEKNSRRSSLRKPGKPFNPISNNVNQSVEKDHGIKNTSTFGRNNQIVQQGEPNSKSRNVVKDIGPIQKVEKKKRSSITKPSSKLKPISDDVNEKIYKETENGSEFIEGFETDIKIKENGDFENIDENSGNKRRSTRRIPSKQIFNKLPKFDKLYPENNSNSFEASKIGQKLLQNTQIEVFANGVKIKTQNEQNTKFEKVETWDFADISQILEPKVEIQEINIGKKDTKMNVNENVKPKFMQGAMDTDIQLDLKVEQLEVGNDIVETNINPENDSFRLEDFEKYGLKFAKEKTFSCQHCEKAFNQKYHLTRHNLIHTGEKSHACKDCDKMFGSEAHLKRHNLVHTGEKPHSCSFCEKKFSLKDSLKQHKTIHTGEKPHCCSYCNRKFRLQQVMKKHEGVHTGVKPYSCDNCEKKFRLKITLKRHKMIHTGKKPHSCSFCKKKFSLKDACKLHERIHTGEKPHSCTYCSKKFRMKEGMKKHERIHTGEKPYTCKYCDKTFSVDNSCRKHERIHTGEKPNSCEFCNKKFRLQQSLESHERIHTGEKPYKCNHCEETFRQSHHVKRHELIHTGEFPYSCKHCKTKFRHSSTLKRHELTHKSKIASAVADKMIKYSCKVCKKDFAGPKTLRIHERVHSKEKDDTTEESIKLLNAKKALKKS